MFRGLLALALLAPVSAPAAAYAVAAPGCAPQADARQAKLDQDGVAQAQAGGLSLAIVRQCAGFSVVVQDSIDAASAADYASAAEQAYARLAQETGATLSPRAVLFVFADQDNMATGERVIAGIRNATREPRAGYAWANTVWLDDSAHHFASSRTAAVSHEFSHLFAAATARGQDDPQLVRRGARDGQRDQFPSRSLSGLLEDAR